jgi:hypothetical protein
VETCKDGHRGHLLGLTEDVAQVGQQADAEAGLSLGGCRYKRYSRSASALGPIPANGIGNGEQGFPHVSIPVFNA